MGREMLRGWQGWKATFLCIQRDEYVCPAPCPQIPAPSRYRRWEAGSWQGRPSRWREWSGGWQDSRPVHLLGFGAPRGTHRSCSCSSSPDLAWSPTQTPLPFHIFVCSLVTEGFLCEMRGFNGSIYAFTQVLTSSTCLQFPRSWT